MNRKGAGNIEFILAFILFVSFVVSALYFFNPTRSSQTLGVSKDFIVSAVVDRASVSLDSYSVFVDAPAGIKEVSVEISGIESGKMARVEDYYGKELASKRTSGGVCFERDNLEDFVIVHFSEDFGAGTADCGAGWGGYTIASSVHEKVLSEKKLVALNDSYYNDYDNLKKQMDIPLGMDFSFELEFQNGEKLVSERSRPLRAEVFAETMLGEVIRADGSSEFAYLTVKAW